MALGLRNQIEGWLTHQIVTEFGEKPWGRKGWSRRFLKDCKHRRERRRAKADPECPPEYRRYWSYEH